MYAAPEHEKDRESAYAAPERRADRESIQNHAAPKHQADRESMPKPVACKRHGKTEAGKKGEFVPEIEFVPFTLYSILPSTFYSESISNDVPDVGAEGFASDEELYAEKARKQLEAKENAVRFRPGSATGQSTASTGTMSRNRAKKLRQRTNKRKQAGESIQPVGMGMVLLFNQLVGLLQLGMPLLNQLQWRMPLRKILSLRE